MQTAHLATQEAEHVQESASLQDIRRLTFDDVVLELTSTLSTVKCRALWARFAAECGHAVAQPVV